MSQTTNTSQTQNLKEYFIKTTQSLGIQTRIVPCALELEYAPLKNLDNPNAENIAKEYQILGEQGSNTISQAMSYLHKEGDSTNAMIIELLSQIYQKVSRIERVVMKTSDEFVALECKASIAAFGHGVICCNEECFGVGEDYYARFVLPNILQRTIGVYAKSLNPQILKFTSIHSSDVSALDNFIASKEMEQLRKAKDKKC